MIDRYTSCIYTLCRLIGLALVVLLCPACIENGSLVL